MRNSEYPIDEKEVLRYLGSRGRPADGATLRRVQEMTALCRETARPVFRYVLFPVTVEDEDAKLGGTDTVLRGRDIARHLQGAVRCALMAVTLGAETDRRQLLLERESMADAVVFDAVCTAMTESAADACEEKLRRDVSAEGYFLNSRYSPGYGDFPVTQQGEVLDLLDAGRRLGITLTEGFLMLPRKSVSAVLGIFRERPESAARGCGICSMRETCRVRKEGGNCGKEFVSPD